MIEFQLFLFGIIVGHRTFLILREEQTISQRLHLQLFAAWSMILIILSLFENQRLVLGVIVGLLLSPWILKTWIIHSQKEKVEKQIRELLNETICSLRAGLGVREGVKNFFARAGKNTRILQNINQRAESEQKLPAWLEKESAGMVLLQIIDAQKSQKNVLEVLSQIKKGLQVQDELARKTSSATAPAKVQAMMILVLYFGLFFFQLSQQSGFLFSIVFWISSLLLSMSLLALHFLKRRFQWSGCHGY